MVLLIKFYAPHDSVKVLQTFIGAVHYIIPLILTT